LQHFYITKISFSREKYLKLQVFTINFKKIMLQKNKEKQNETNQEHNLTKSNSYNGVFYVDTSSHPLSRLIIISHIKHQIKYPTV
jgi:hypothetical protein